MLVYRDNGRAASGEQLKFELLRALGRVECDPTGDATLAALLRAGEFECALADLQHASSARVAHVTNAMAARVLTGHVREQMTSDLQTLERAAVPSSVRIVVPEGYAYYALDPVGYASMVDQLGQIPARIAVIGVRSIGTSLGAIVLAALHERGVVAKRISVRPNGHPWARTLSWSPAERAFVEKARDAAADFIVVDEGPGLSGSTFLAVAEALERLGVASRRIALFCSHLPDSTRLTAHDAVARWARYRCYAPNAEEPTSGEHDLSAGAWRQRVYGPERRRWPASWAQLERVKRLSVDGRFMDKFEGLPPYCEAAIARAQAIEQEGYGPSVHGVRRGFARFAWLSGKPARTADLKPPVIAELARYCAFRLRAFSVATVEQAPLIEMLRTNVAETFGVEVGDRVQIAIEAPIIPDARMQPHEWCVTRGRRFVKLDGHGDGDGHLLPGPTDVCWDLAGAVVEWNMDRHQQELLVSEFERLTGKHVQSRLTGFLLAYAASRVGEMSLALLSAQSDEVERTALARARYRRRLERLLQAQRLLS